MEPKELLIVTGMSGAGKTSAMSALEDLGYFTAQNMPAALLPHMWRMIGADETITKAAIMMDHRSGEFFSDLEPALAEIKADPTLPTTVRVIFLDASNHELVSRYKETRRQHYLAGEKGTLAGIVAEREELASIRHQASDIIRTDEFTAKQLRNYMFEHYGDDVNGYGRFTVQVMSFGFKHGIAEDADMVMDVRFLRNPYYDEALRPQSGLDQPVQAFVWENPDAQTYYDMVKQQVEWLLPRYQAEGKSAVTIAFGCTGGQHRSVAFAHRLAQDLEQNWQVNEYHRNMQPKPE